MPAPEWHILSRRKLSHEVDAASHVRVWPLGAPVPWSCGENIVNLMRQLLKKNGNLQFSDFSTNTNFIYKQNDLMNHLQKTPT